MTDWPKVQLPVVPGQGGTGKSTVAAALAFALAGAGRNVLLCEVEGRQGIARMSDVAIATTRVSARRTKPARELARDGEPQARRIRRDKAGQRGSRSRPSNRRRERYAKQDR